MEIKAGGLGMKGVMNATTGPIGGVLASVAGDIGKAVGGGAGILNNVLGSVGKAFGSLFAGGSAQGAGGQSSPTPTPFSLGSIAGGILKNPAGPLSAIGNSSIIIVGGLPGILNKIAGQLGAVGGGGSPAPSGGTGGWGDPHVKGGPGAGIDSMMDQANAIMNNPNASQQDMLKAQKLMSDASKLFDAISKMMQQQSDMAKQAISNIH